MKGYKKNGKFIPVSKRNKSALKKADVKQHVPNIDEDFINRERPEFAHMIRKR